MDNIGVFDRSKPLPVGERIAQADGTAWMAFYCTTMLAIALELAQHNPGYEDVASKFFEHFVAIAEAMHQEGGGLWDEADGFYYDRLMIDGRSEPMRIRSIGGLVPLFAVEVLHGEVLAALPSFTRRMNWFLEHRRDLRGDATMMEGCQQVPRTGSSPCPPAAPGVDFALSYGRGGIPLAVRHSLLSRFHEAQPFVLHAGSAAHTVRYAPGESDTSLFGGNSNWRGPVWLPVNFLIIEALERYHHFYGDTLTVECPRGAGVRLNLLQVADEIARRLVALFLPDADGRRPCHGTSARYATDPWFRRLVLFSRILPRRERPRRRRQSPDGVDSAGREAGRGHGPAPRWVSTRQAGRAGVTATSAGGARATGCPACGACGAPGRSPVLRSSATPAPR